MANSSSVIRYYSQEYFSGTQINIVLNSHIIEEITSLQVSIEEKKMPIYGYASRKFDKVASGVVLVQGTFTINFVHPNYLINGLLRNSIIRKQNSAIPGSIAISNENTSSSKTRLFKSGDDRLSIDVPTLLQQIETGKDSNGEILSPEKKAENLQSFAALNLDSFKDAEEYLVDTLWGSEQDSNNSPDILLNSIQGFDIQIQYGDPEERDTSFFIRNIFDVYLVSLGKAIMINGEPIAEQYNFIARFFN